MELTGLDAACSRCTFLTRARMRRSCLDCPRWSHRRRAPATRNVSKANSALRPGSGCRGTRHTSEYSWLFVYGCGFLLLPREENRMFPVRPTQAAAPGVVTGAFREACVLEERQEKSHLITSRRGPVPCDGHCSGIRLLLFGFRLTWTTLLQNAEEPRAHCLWMAHINMPSMPCADLFRRVWCISLGY